MVRRWEIIHCGHTDWCGDTYQVLDGHYVYHSDYEKDIADANKRADAAEKRLADLRVVYPRLDLDLAAIVAAQERELAVLREYVEAHEEHYRHSDEPYHERVYDAIQDYRKRED